MSCLKKLDISWNCMRYIRDEFAILRKHAPLLENLNTQHNLWLKVRVTNTECHAIVLVMWASFLEHNILFKKLKPSLIDLICINRLKNRKRISPSSDMQYFCWFMLGVVPFSSMSKKLPIVTTVPTKMR